MSQPLSANSLDQELLTSPKRRGQTSSSNTSSGDDEAKPAVALGKRILLVCFYLSLALVAFLAFLLPKLPFERLSSSMFNFLSQQTPYIWQSTGTELHIWGPTLEVKGLTLTSKPFGFGSAEMPSKISFEEFSLSPSILGSMPLPWIRPFSPSSAFDFSVFQGSASGHAGVRNGDDFHVTLTGEKFNLQKLASAINLPNLDLKGAVQTINADITISQGKMARTNGNFLLGLKSVQLDPSGFELPMPLPVLNLGDIYLQGTITNGRLVFDKSVIGSSTNDIEVFVDGSMNLVEPIEFSSLDLKLRLKMSNKLTQALPLAEKILAAGKRPDGYYGLKINGTLSNIGLPQAYAGN